MDQLTFSTIHYKEIRERLQSAEPGLDEQILTDTVEGLTDLKELLAAIFRAALNDEALVTGLKGRIAQMENRRDRLGNRATKRRQIVRETMTELDLKKIIAPDFTASLRPGTASLVVLDEASIPSVYWKPRGRKLDRVALTADLKQGKDVAGATLSNSAPVLSVRTG